MIRSDDGLEPLRLPDTGITVFAGPEPLQAVGLYVPGAEPSVTVLSPA